MEQLLPPPYPMGARRDAGLLRRFQSGDFIPSSDRLPRRAIAASTVLLSRQAIVIGPTPPGTGVMAPAVHRLHKSDVSCEPRTAGIIGNAIDADVDHDGAGLDPCATDHLVTAYRRHQYVRGPHQRREVPGF